jgi:HK97 family phage major capsid protein
MDAPVTVEEFEARQTAIEARLAELDTEHAGQVMPDEARAEWDRLEEEHERNVTTLEELRYRRERVQGLSADEDRREDGTSFHTQRAGVARGEDIWDLTTVRSSFANPAQAAGELRDRAMRAVEQSDFPHEDADQDAVRKRIERLLVTAETERGDVSRHLLVTGSPEYRRAFGKAVAGQPLSDGEQRALSLAGASGGYAVPFQLDPTIIPTSNGSVNPYRAISRVETISGSEWKGVSSDGVVATRALEAAQVADGSPTLAQPAVKVEKVHAFVPFSIELDQDWSSLQAELARMLQDAKDDEEAESFTLGNGTAPATQGIITGATTTVDTATASTFARGDLDLAESALPPRFQPRAQWVANRAFYQKVRRFDTGGGADLWVRIAEGIEHGGNTGHELLGYAANEASSMEDDLTTAGGLIAVLGDFRYFLIVDRIGMTVEVVPHLMGANGRPTGQRGLYAYWRNNSKVLSPKAFRVLKIKA